MLMERLADPTCGGVFVERVGQIDAELPDRRARKNQVYRDTGVGKRVMKIRRWYKEVR